MIGEATKAYIAGILDGEGSITAKVSQGKYYLRVSITNTNIKLVQWFVAALGIDFSVHAYKGRKANHKTAYRMTWAGQCAIDFLEMVQPYLVLKQDHATIAIAAFKAGALTSLGEEAAKKLHELNIRGLKVMGD